MGLEAALPERCSTFMRLYIAMLLFALAPMGLIAASVEVTLRDGRGAVLRDAVVYATTDAPQPRPKRMAVMDQKDRMFVPHVLVIQTGTSVIFPNSDDIRHQVYSFSPPKMFQLPLYKGTPAAPVLFDKAGVVTLGCNIHDRMSAFIVVVDTPYFATSDGRGKASLDLEPGRYSVHAWFPDASNEPAPQELVITGEEQRKLSFVNGRSQSNGSPGAGMFGHGHP